MKKEQFMDWWKQDKRYLTLVKAVLMALLPVVCCLFRVVGVDGVKFGVGNFMDSRLDGL